MAHPTTPNLLEASGLPLFYPIRSDDGQVPEVPGAGGHAVAVRSIVRSLTVMQKEAVVASSGSPVAWRLSSDEGPYLAGHDAAPAPLTITTAGLAADLMTGIRRAMEAAGLPVDGLEVTLQTHYTMEGSMLAGTMTGGANPPEVAVSTTADPTLAMDAVRAGVDASATAGLHHPSHTSLFSLTANGVRIPVGRVAEVDADVPKDPGGGHLDPPDPEPGFTDAGLVTKLDKVDSTSPDAGSSLRESQSRALHLRARGSWRSDGVKQLDVELIRPSGSTFRILSDEPPGQGGSGRAPDALTLISAGLGFCFMTQFGRFAKITKRDLGDYRIVQDTRFSVGEGRGSAPETHVYLDPDGDDDFAREALDMSEQTCFLHAMCRTELRPKVEIVAG